MNFKALFAIIVCLAPIFAFGQSSSASNSEIDRVYGKILKLNLVKFIQPILLKKGQINDLLTSIEKCHAKRDDINDKDAAEFKKLEAGLDKALDEAYGDGKYPNEKFMENIIKVQEAIKIRRAIAVSEMTDIVLATCKKDLNAGQLAVIKNLIDPAFVGGKEKLDKMSEDDRTKLFIREIFLADMAYDILKQMAKHASE